MEAAPAVDVHQHLWPEQLVDRLRARRRPPYLRDWVLHTHGEPELEVSPSHHDVAQREAADHQDGVGLACVSLSAPLGIESLVRPEASVLLAAWHAGARELPGHFRAWASVPAQDPDPAELAALLAEDTFVGLQLPASDLLAPAAWDRLADVLRVVELAGKPLFVHPGSEPARPLAGRLPGWWAPVVGYVAQLQAAWWGWHAVQGRAQFPSLRVLFAAGAGLAPVHHERHVARGGGSAPIDRDVFVDTSSYGPQAVDALARVLGIDVLALGSDRPYAVAIDRLPGAAVTRAVRTTNPVRLLTGDVRPHGLADVGRRGERTWPRAS
jgi:6-methylsalicylate decarboxylase